MKRAKRQSIQTSLRHDIITVVVGIVLFILGAVTPLPDPAKIILMIIGIAIIIVANAL